MSFFPRAFTVELQICRCVTNNLGFVFVGDFLLSTTIVHHHLGAYLFCPTTEKNTTNLRNASEPVRRRRFVFVFFPNNLSRNSREILDVRLSQKSDSYGDCGCFLAPDKGSLATKNTTATEAASGK